MRSDDDGEVGFPGVVSMIEDPLGNSTLAGMAGWTLVFGYADAVGVEWESSFRTALHAPLWPSSGRGCLDDLRHRN